jgi:hypothetical protein
MGKSTDDLPDPTQAGGASADASTDELLSQLAGDEIDKLLAEADVEAADDPTPTSPPPAVAQESAPPGESPAPAVTAETPDDAAAALQSQLDDVFNQLTKSDDAPSPVADVGAPAESAPISAPALDDQLSKLANELLPTGTPPDAAPVTQVDSAAPSPTDAAASAIATDDPAGLSAEEADRQQLLGELPAETDTDVLLESEPAGPAPWYLKPLCWLNAPFASLPDSLRALAGKAAVATTLFSIAILAYLAVIRHKL